MSRIWSLLTPVTQLPFHRLPLCALLDLAFKACVVQILFCILESTTRAKLGTKWPSPRPSNQGLCIFFRFVCAQQARQVHFSGAAPRPY